ncbi:MAG: M3 family metallopeptidase, partial [Candidatus Acidifodinimicrobium sp.]
WDIDADPLGRPALKPFEKTSDLEDGVQRIFTKIDTELGRYFSSMRDDFLDLQSRPNKAPGAYCGGYNATGKPYIFANTVGINDDVGTLLHESGHAFHFIESSKQKLVWNKSSLEPVNYEFAEVASMSMELLGSTYLEKADGGFYDKSDANRARSEQLLGIMMFLPYMSVVDLFQHWVYTEAPQEIDPSDLDRKWGELWDRFMSWQDWSGLEDEKVTGWHRKGHIFSSPFYYIEYGLAQLGAIQIWRNFMRDKDKTVHDYRYALSLGNTRSLPQLFKSAGIEIIFDRSKLHELMEFVQNRFERFL